MNVVIGRVHKNKVSSTTRNSITKNKISKICSKVNHVPVTRSRMKSAVIENSENSNSNHMESQILTHKRQKLDNKEEIDYNFDSQKLESETCEKENMVDFTWLKSNTSKSIFSPNYNKQETKFTSENWISGQNNEGLTIDKMNSKVQKSRIESPQLSNIGSQDMSHQSPEFPWLKRYALPNEHGNQVRDYHKLNEFGFNKSISEHSLNDVWSFISERKPNNEFNNHEQVLQEFCIPSVSIGKKRSRKKIDPATEKRNQNFEWFKEYCKLKVIHNLITKELKSIKEDDAKYEQKLNIINENKERHEDDLGYYLGIEDSRRKRVRRLATEIERKHRWLVPKWSKAYGSEGSLNQHLLRKHPLVFEEWMKRITEKENENQHKKNQISREEKDQIRKEIEKLWVTLWKDDTSNYDNSDSD